MIYEDAVLSYGGGGNDPEIGSCAGGDGGGGKFSKLGGDNSGGGNVFHKGGDFGVGCRMKPIFTILTMAVLLGACSFQSDNHESAQGTSITSASEQEIDPRVDSDGDGVKNIDEITQGRNPFLADIPDLNLQFMKDFTLTYDLGGRTFQVDSLRDIRSKNFEYRVGSITAFDIVKKTTAQFARYDGVVVGDYKDIDLTRISYPYVSPQFLALQGINQEIGLLKNTKVEFTNTLKLERNRGFQTIVNPTFNFHFFNYETGEYELIAQKKIEKVIYEGALEKFNITLEGLPQKLIEENFMQKGEFVTAEIDDFEIPSMNTTYKKLMSSIMEKCIPITVISPVGTKVFYVALNSANNLLGQFLKSIYRNNFKIENNELTQIDGITNNLPKFKLLSELTNLTKVGKWFILINNEINDNVYQYAFKKGDKIVLNYMTGAELSNQTYKQNIANLPGLTSEKNTRDFEIGEVGQNDELQLVLRAKNITEDYTTSTSWGFNDTGGNSSWIYQSILKRTDNFSFTDQIIQKRLALVLNGKEYFLSDLIKEKTITAVFDDNIFKISIPSVSKVFAIDNDETHVLLLRVHPDNHQEDIGVWLTGIGGWAASQAGCNSADAVCRSWFTSFPVSLVCGHIQTVNTNACTGVLKNEFRRKTQILQKDLQFDASFLLLNKYN